MPLPGGYAKTAAATDAVLQRQLLQQARAVARLMERRRKLRKSLRDTEDQLRTAKRFLRAMVQDHNTPLEDAVRPAARKARER